MCAVKICETNLLGLRPIRASLGLRYITFRKNAPSSKHFYSCYNVLRKDLASSLLGLRPIRASLGLRYITFRKNAPSSKHFYSCYNVLRKDL